MAEEGTCVVAAEDEEEEEEVELGVVGGFGSVALIKLLAVFFGSSPTELHYLNGLARTDDDDERWARRKAVPPPPTLRKRFGLWI